MAETEMKSSFKLFFVLLLFASSALAIPETPPAGLYDTSATFSDGKGKFSVERQALHGDIVDELLKEGATSEAPRLVLMGGPPGAGKTTVINMLREDGSISTGVGGEFMVIDVDRIKTMIPEYEAFQKIDVEKAAQMVHRESGHIQGLLYYKALALGKNIIVDGTLAKTEVFVFTLNELKEKYPSYETAILLVDASIETLIERVETRAKETGRHVPLDTVRDFKKVIRGSVEKLRDLVDVTFDIDFEDKAVLKSVYRHGYEFKTDADLPFQGRDKKFFEQLLKSPRGCSVAEMERLLLG